MVETPRPRSDAATPTASSSTGSTAVLHPLQSAADDGGDAHRAGPSTTRDSTDTEVTPRPEAGPLPLKRGEIGFQERYLRQLAEGDDDDSDMGDAPAVSRPERHPADRDGHAADQASRSAVEPPSESEQRAETASTRTVSSVRKRFAARVIPALGGVHLATLLWLLFQGTLIIATITGWVVFGQRGMGSNNKGGDPEDPDGEGNSNPMTGATSSIFIHVLFTVALLMQLVFLERQIYRIRAERYAFANPGLPLFARPGGAAVGMGYAPWNRPPLPTYAAVLAQSGVGTGDVEDSAIAVAPPPAYGNTRGSTLLLSGLISDTLRAQRRGRSVRSSVASSRPVSYASHDGEWEERRDATRAMRLQETLARLEDSQDTQETQNNAAGRRQSPSQAQ